MAQVNYETHAQAQAAIAALHGKDLRSEAEKAVAPSETGEEGAPKKVWTTRPTCLPPASMRKEEREQLLDKGHQAARPDRELGIREASALGWTPNN